MTSLIASTSGYPYPADVNPGIAFLAFRLQQNGQSKGDKNKPDPDPRKVWSVNHLVRPVSVSAA